MRILVMIRKNWGGNRTVKGARTQAVLTSILCTAKQQDKDVFGLLVDLLRSAEPKLLDLLPKEVAMIRPRNQRSAEATEIRKPFDPPAPIPFLPSVAHQSATPPIFDSP